MPTKTILCIGDSHTKGQLGGGFVPKAQQLLGEPDLQLLAYGVNGETTESIGKRLGQILQRHPQPAAVFIMPGSNDCLAREHPALQTFYNWAFTLSRPCSLQYALDNVSHMIDQVHKVAPGTKVAIITIPPHTEQPDQPAHQRVEMFNNALKEMLGANYPTVQIVDFYSAVVEYLQKHHPAYEQYRPLVPGPHAAAKQRKRSTYDMIINPWYNFSLLSIVRDQVGSALLHHCWGLDWNSISRRRGLYLLTDNVHMNDTAAGILAELLVPVVKEL